jgi:hypothetical protein
MAKLQVYPLLLLASDEAEPRLRICYPFWRVLMVLLISDMSEAEASSLSDQ